jgi:hypothetical protein
MKDYQCRLIFGFIVYNLWRNRNAVRYTNHPKTEEKLLKQIIWKVRIQFLSKGN